MLGSATTIGCEDGSYASTFNCCTAVVLDVIACTTDSNSLFSFFYAGGYCAAVDRGCDILLDFCLRLMLVSGINELAAVVAVLSVEPSIDRCFNVLGEFNAAATGSSSLYFFYFKESVLRSNR